MACHVLRCLNAAAHTIRVSKPGAPRFDARVCEDHYQRIQSGEDYEWDFDQHVIYMGDDVKATGEYLYEDMTVTEDVGHNDLKFRLELRRRGSDERTWIDVRMSHAQAREVAQVFQMFARED